MRFDRAKWVGAHLITAAALPHGGGHTACRGAGHLARRNGRPAPFGRRSGRQDARRYVLAVPGCVQWAARAGLVSLLLIGTALPAATFTWIKNSGGNASGSWSNQANWSGGTLPTTANDAVAFNTLDLTADSTVTLDGNQTVNALSFGDTATGTAANWVVNAGSPSSSTLTLGGASPTISVTSLGSGKAAAINAIITGTIGLTKTGTSFLQLNAVNTYSGGTILSGSDCRTSIGNDLALGTGLVTVGGTVGDGQNWFNAAGSRTTANAFEIRTIRWIIDNTTVNGVSAGNLTVKGSVLLNTGSSNVRDIYCNMNLTINGNVSVTPASNPMNKQVGDLLTLNGTNTVGGASAVNGGTLIVNGPMNGGATFTVNSGCVLGGTGIFSGTISVANGGNLTVGSGGSGTLTCGGLPSVSGAAFNYALGATNNATNGFIKVNGSAMLAGTLRLTDLGGFSSGVYTGLQYSGSVKLNGLTVGSIPGGKSVVVETNTPGCVLFHVLNGVLNPTAGQDVPMDLASPLALGWVEVPGSAAYDVYLGTVSNSVASATTNTVGIYQGRTSTLTLNISGLQPNTAYYWHADGVAANGTLTVGMVLSFTTGAPIVDLMEDTWVATDALNRSLPGLAECGSPRTNRPIGLFYYLWYKFSSFGSGTNWDVSQYLSAHPYSSPDNPWADSPVFQTSLSTYWWGRPELDYYAPSDPWMLRRQIARLSHAGVMIRESLDSGARHVMMVLTPGNGVAFQQRVAPLGASATTTLGPSVAPPYWVRIVRRGDAFTDYASTNGTNWTQVGTVSIAGFNRTALWGLAVTAHHNTLTNVATFDQVTLSSSAPVFPPIPNQAVIAGQTLVVTNAASDPDAPLQTLTFAALTAPTNAIVDPVTDLFTWRPTIAQSPLVTRVQLEVQDNVVPSLSATQSFWVTVNRPVQPQLGGIVSTNGAFGLRISGDRGPDYTIQGKTNLDQFNPWVMLLTTNSPAVPFWWTDLETNLPQRYYRMLLGP